jgi:hypothetical protein
MTSNSISNRKDARDSLVTALETITGFQEHYDHLPVDLQGQSPVCTVEAVSQMTTFDPAVTETFQFIVGVWVIRASEAGSDAANAEDTLDGLAQDVTEIVQTWHNGIFYQPSEATYEELENGQYRVEWFYVSVDWE